jgi:hypothetical protein
MDAPSNSEPQGKSYVVKVKTDRCATSRTWQSDIAKTAGTEIVHQNGNAIVIFLEPHMVENFRNRYDYLEFIPTGG